MTTVRTSTTKLVKDVPVSMELPFPTRLRWMEKAKCLRKGTYHFWLKQSRPTPEQYQKVIETWCLPCPVRPECLLNVLRKENEAGHVSRGVEGGATPRERAILRKRIRDGKLCLAEGVWRWLNNKPLTRQFARKGDTYAVTISNEEGTLVYRGQGSTARGAHMIVVRELRLRTHDLIATIKRPDGKIIEVLRTQEIPTKKSRSRKSPYHEPF